MLCCFKNYYHNIFFLIDNKYYIYVYINKLNYIYKFDLINNNLILNIKNKDITKNEKINLKIMYDNKEVFLNFITKSNKINLGNLHHYKYNISQDDKININNQYFEDNLCKLFPNFDNRYYIINNNFLNNNYLENNKYIIYHWYLCGQNNPQFYFKYLLKKYEENIMKIKYPFIQYSDKKTKTLLFIDDRYDPSFLYLLVLFLYSIDLSWNITIFTTEDNIKNYENDLNKLQVSGNILILDNKFNNTNEYSKLLKNEKFWLYIKEDNCLLFQYDSFCMGKFDTIFLDYTYIGARWPHQACNNNNIRIGNGGTSFRKTRIMELICKKNKENKKLKDLPEDIFFSELLYEENLLNCTDEIADKFSFENIYNDFSVYAHQIYNTIELSELDNFVYKNIEAMCNS